MAAKLSLVETMELPFLLSIPRGRDEAQEGTGLPILCFLHGLDEGPPTKIEEGVTRHGPLRKGSSPLATGDFIVVAPQLPACGDIWQRYAGAVCEIVSFLQTEYGADNRRSYLSGFSFGGNGVMDIAIFNPSLWAALWPVDPTRVPVSDPGLPFWFSAGQASRPRADRFIDRLQLRPPVTGLEDRVYVDEGLDHVATATSAYRSDEVYRWLLSKKRQA
jgi:predicted peptidase